MYHDSLLVQYNNKYNDNDSWLIMIHDVLIKCVGDLTINLNDESKRYDMKFEIQFIFW